MTRKRDRSMILQRLTLMLTLLMVAGSLSSADAAPIPKDSTSWSGLVPKDRVGVLPNQLKNRDDKSRLSFAMGIGHQAKDFVKFLQPNADERQASAYATWLQKVDWNKEVVLYAVLELHTNRLTYKGYGVDKSGITVLQLQWSGIEPFYRGSYPAVFARIPKADLRRAVISINLESHSLNTVVFAKDKPANNEKAAVRELKIDRKGLRPRFGRQGATIFASLDALDKAHGEKVSVQVKKQVDFTKEDVVVVNWTTGGPPFGTLKYEMKKAKVGMEVLFYVQGPKFPPGKPAVRGRALKLGFDLFAVPKKIKVTLERGERK